jgi:hypothetical protein
MKIPLLIGILLLVAGIGQSDDLIFFADDHYKSLGEPHIVATVVNPVLKPGECVLKIDLANIGDLEELMLINKSGSEEDLLLEMREEMKSSDAQNIDAGLIGSDQIAVTSGRQHIDNLPSGEKASINFSVRSEENATGWHELMLDVLYERQADVSAKNGEAFPLFEAERQNLTVKVLVPGGSESLKISANGLKLYPGTSGSLKLAVINDGHRAFHNCSARLLAAPPFYPEGQKVLLGDLFPGSVAVASFSVKVDRVATISDYQLGCEIECNEKSTVIPLEVAISPSGIFDNWAIPALAVLMISSLAAVLAAKRFNLLHQEKRRRRSS